MRPFKLGWINFATSPRKQRQFINWLLFANCCNLTRLTYRMFVQWNKTRSILWIQFISLVATGVTVSRIRKCDGRAIPMREKTLETGQSWHLCETFLWEVHYANWEGNYIKSVSIRRPCDDAHGKERFLSVNAKKFRSSDVGCRPEINRATFFSFYFESWARE